LDPITRKSKGFQKGGLIGCYTCNVVKKILRKNTLGSNPTNQKVQYDTTLRAHLISKDYCRNFGGLKSFGFFPMVCKMDP
jgi:hypothetical protein